jgi:predicted metal-binding protein
MEELGIDCNLEFLGKIFNEFRESGLTLRYFTGIFLGRFSGNVSLNDELSEMRRLSVKELEEMINKNKDAFSPGFINDFLHVKDRLK